MKRIIPILFSLWFSIGAFGQSTENVADPQIPSNPSLSIIGMQTTEITRPGNYTGLYTNLLTPLVSNNGTIPTDLALEFSPFYLKSRDMTLNEIDHSNIGRDSKLSIASNSVKGVDSTIFPRLGLGYRTNIIAGKINRQRADSLLKGSSPADIEFLIDRIKDNEFGDLENADAKQMVSEFENLVISKEVEDLINKYKSDKEELIPQLTEFRKKVEGMVKEQADDAKYYDLSLRLGHFLEFAGAVAVDFPNNTMDYSTVQRWGIWLNYTYRPATKKQGLDFSGLIRISNYSFDPTIVFEEPAIFADMGIGIKWKPFGPRFVLSGDYIGKFGATNLRSGEGDGDIVLKGINESRWNASLGYQITPTTLWSVSLSDTDTDAKLDLEGQNVMQFLMGISAAIGSLKQ